MKILNSKINPGNAVLHAEADENDSFIKKFDMREWNHLSGDDAVSRFLERESVSCCSNTADGLESYSLGMLTALRDKGIHVKIDDKKRKLSEDRTIFTRTIRLATNTTSVSVQ
jgi:hypothetical protein